jgi:ligand-binding SRPBCC domain-containing protein
MPYYQLFRSQRLAANLDQMWDFISSPVNLKEITPPYMGFELTHKLVSDKMYPGMIITYRVRPVFGIKLTWVSEITRIRELEYFVDEQKAGPYKVWRHEHKLEPIAGGVLMTDIVTYQPPFGFIGAIANILFIKRQLQNIFDYRAIALEKRFGKYIEP